MQLRKRVNPPKRYKPELNDSAFEQRYTPPTDKPIFNIPYVEFNSYLPPAAFPTLDSAEVALRQSQAKINRNPKPQPNNRSDEYIFADISDSNAQSLFPTAMPSPSKRQANGSDPRQIRYPGVTENDVETDLEHSNSNRNPIYKQNLKMLNEFKRRSGTDWIAMEMDTSDEDDGQCEDEPLDVSGAKTETSSNRGKRPDWEDVTVELRLEILHNLTEHGHTTLDAMQQLGLTQSQQDALNHDITQYNQRLDIEDTHLELLRIGTHERLLHGKLHIEAAQLDLMQDGKHKDEAKERHFKGIKSRMNRFAQAGYKRLMDNHLGGLLLDADQADYSLTSTSALRRAQSFLKSKGMDISFAGDWTKVCESLGQEGGGNSLRGRPTDFTPASSSRILPDGDLTLNDARTIYAEMICENPIQNTVQNAAIQTPLTIPQPYSSCKGPPQTIQTKDSSQINLSAGEEAPVDSGPTSKKLNKGSASSRDLPNSTLADCAGIPRNLALASKAETTAMRPSKPGIKRTLSGIEITENARKNQAPKTPLNKVTEKQPSNPDSKISQGSADSDRSTIPARRRPTKLTLTTHALETPAGPAFPPLSNPSDPMKTRSQSSSDKPIRSPTARRLPARYSDSLPDTASSAGSSNRRSSYTKMMTDWASPPQTVSPLTTSMEKASIEDGEDERQTVAERTRAAVQSQNGPGRRGRPRKTSVIPMHTESIAPIPGASAPTPSEQGKKHTGKKVASRTQTPNPTSGPSSKVAPPKLNKGTARKTKK